MFGSQLERKTNCYGTWTGKGAVTVCWSWKYATVTLRIVWSHCRIKSRICARMSPWKPTRQYLKNLLGKKRKWQSSFLFNFISASATQDILNLINIFAAASNLDFFKLMLPVVCFYHTRFVSCFSFYCLQGLHKLHEFLKYGSSKCCIYFESNNFCGQLLYWRPHWH